MGAARFSKERSHEASQRLGAELGQGRGLCSAGGGRGARGVPWAALVYFGVEELVKAKMGEEPFRKHRKP